MQRAALLPQLYDIRKVEEMFLRTLKIPEKDVLQPKPASENMDPVSENVAVSMARPIYVLPQQDHLAHIMIHMAFLKSPLFGANPTIIKQFIWSMVQHIKDHVLNYYLVEAHTAVDKAQSEKIITNDAEQEVPLILRVQGLIEQKLNGFAEELGNLDKLAEQYKPQPQMPPDSTMQVAQLGAQIQGQMLQQRAAIDQARMQFEGQKLQAEQSIEGQKMQDDQQLEAQKMQADQQLEAQKMAAAQQKNSEQLQIVIFKEEQENMREAEANATRERMNTADNETAKLLAAAEIATGEKIAVSTGTGINPNP